MEPKLKAKELVDKYCALHFEQKRGSIIIDLEKAKQCALIAVDFAMNSKYSFQPMHGGWVSGKLHYEELKKEIEKL